MASCLTDATRELLCRDSRAATHLKLISILVIFVTSIIGISSPVLLARLFQGKPVYDKALLVIKCFAAGVILSTSLVHVLPDAFDALSDCKVATHHPWKDFPFAGLVTLIGALLALLVDVSATSHVHGNKQSNYTPIGTQEVELSIDSSSLGKNLKSKSKSKSRVEPQIEIGVVVQASCHIDGENSNRQTPEEIAKLKQRLVSQVLEIGIIFHSVIIGVTMGMSQNQCTIRPLVAALAFHQIFEGMGLGGCIAQAGFGVGTTSYMCFLFSVTTPMGIILGMIVFSVTGYSDDNPKALILEGLLGSLSSGILIYMALVDLIAADFFHNKMMSSETWLTKTCYIALVLGSASMSILALWA
ncbi:zinc transporter 6, chloroplastic-like [Telopea speciosissima]|uniref:zinc transporter 6, chloroplastic-like n=1 Tax=Telopea speciosissima TaxID=54955 RepID=UPI001CC6F861|nr:zinc transporter 6, chloroplastic-like [Telopea speciosissima]